MLLKGANYKLDMANNKERNKAIGWVVGGLAAIIGLAYAFGSKAVDTVSGVIENNILFNVTSIRIRFGFPIVILPIQFEVTNSNVVSATDVSFTGSAYYQNVKIGDIMQQQIIDVPNNETVTGEVELLVNLTKLPDSIIQIFTNRTFSDQVEVRGKLKTNFGTVNITRKLNLL